MEAAHVALGHKLWISGFLESLTHDDDALVFQLRRLADELSRSTAGDGSLCRLDYFRDLTGSGGSGYATATFSTRTGAFAALEGLDGLPIVVGVPTALLGDRVAPSSTFTLRWLLKHPTIRLLDVSPEVKFEDLKQAVSSLAEIKSIVPSRGLGGAPGSSAVVTFKSRAQAANVQRQLGLNLFMLAGYAIPVCAIFEPGAVDDDFDAALLVKDHTDPHPATDAAATGLARCWPDDFVLLSGSLAPGDGPAALLVPRESPTVEAALAAELGAITQATTYTGHHSLIASSDAASAATTFLMHGSTIISISKHAPPPSNSSDNIRRDVARGTPVDAAASVTAAPRAAARLSLKVSQQPRFAQPGTLEYDFALEWRKLQDTEAIEHTLLARVHEERRAHLLARQRARFDSIAATREGTEHWRKVLLQQVHGVSTARGTSGASEEGAEELQAALAALQELVKDQRKQAARTENTTSSRITSPQGDSRAMSVSCDSPRDRAAPPGSDSDVAFSVPATSRVEPPVESPRTDGDVAFSAAAPFRSELPVDGGALRRPGSEREFSASVSFRGESPKDTALPLRPGDAPAAAYSEFRDEMLRDKVSHQRSDGAINFAAFPSVSSAAPSLLGPATLDGQSLLARDASAAAPALVPLADSSLYYHSTHALPQPAGGGLGLLGAPPPAQSAAQPRAELWPQVALSAQFTTGSRGPQASSLGGFADSSSGRGLHSVLSTSAPEQLHPHPVQSSSDSHDHSLPFRPRSSSESRRDSSSRGFDRGRERLSPRSRSPDDDARSRLHRSRHLPSDRSSSPPAIKPPPDELLTLRDLDEFQLRPRVTGRVILLKKGFLIARVDEDFVQRYPSLWVATRHRKDDLWVHISQWQLRWTPSEGDRVELHVAPSSFKAGLLQGERVRVLR